jgi:AraC-like DNA-binding protein
MTARDERPHTWELHASACVTIVDHVCDGRDHGGSAEEASHGNSIAFVRRGAYFKHVRGERVLADANHVTFYVRDEGYRVSHPAGGDACTTFELRPDVLRELLAARDPESAESDVRPFRAPSAPCDSRSHLLHHRLYERLASAPCEDIAVEEIALGICAAVLARPERRRRAPARASTARTHRDTVEAAKITLRRGIGRKIALDEIARSVHCSPFHLARMFQREAGVPMHRYLNRLRLREALPRMRADERDLTALALDLGFADHSHFTNAFRREFGCSPSRVRAAASAREIHELRERA